MYDDVKISVFDAAVELFNILSDGSCDRQDLKLAAYNTVLFMNRMFKRAGVMASKEICFQFMQDKLGVDEEYADSLYEMIQSDYE